MTVSKVKTKIDARYVDDGRTLLMPVKRGWRWTEDGVRWSKDWNAEDEESGESGIKRTSEVVKGMVNSANASLRCTVETGEDFETANSGHKLVGGEWEPYAHLF